MKKIILSIIFFYLIPHLVYAQKENNVWVFPTYCGLNFNGPSPTPTTSKLLWAAINSAASVCDAEGRLLFYTNSDTIWDRNGNPLPFCYNPVWSSGSSGTDGPGGFISYNSPQGVIILPVLNNPNQYYVFTLSGFSSLFGAGTFDFRLDYTIVDMTLNKGLGDIVPTEAHIAIDSFLDDAMAGVSGDNCDIWLMVHERDATVFKAYDITVNGISKTPVLSTTGTFTSLGSYSNGELAFSPNRKKLALVDVNTLFIPPLGTELYDFDPATGTVSNPMEFDSLSLDESVAFSPDNSKVYLSQWGPAYPNGALVQYDISLSSPAAILASQVPLIDTFQTCSFCGAVGEIRRGPDGKIYCTANAAPDGITNYIGCINNPNLPGLACNYVNNVVGFPIDYSTGWPEGLSQALGTDFVKPLVGPTDTVYSRIDKGICVPGIDSIVLHAPSGYFHYLWSDSTTDTIRVAKKADMYIVRSSDYCKVRIDTFAIRKINVSFTLGDDTSFCSPPFPYTLQVSLPGAGYLWQDGSTDSFYTVTQSGTYSLNVSNDGCRDSEKIKIAFINDPQHLGNDTSICNGQPISIALHASAPAGALVTWSDNTYEPTLLVQDTGRYWVTVKDGPCQFSDSISISTQLCDCAFDMPSAFSPNGDGKNDFFQPIIQPGCPVMNYLLTIYNRWGQMVWMSYSPSEGWDGKFNNIPQELGDYMYVIKFDGGTGHKKYFKQGDVTLVR
ncbi:MAG TPA: gliding motility-associated C-terminal domain-containing protein [Flavipsychrobacter sp.]|nr:gliding motility-associated C-terminal domain-containing protein [Flavipsychrobacter sp.]